MTNALAVQAAATFGGILAAGFAAILAAERGRFDRFGSSTLFVRWRTWVVITIPFGAATLAGPTAVALLAGCVATAALTEYARLVRLGTRAQTSMIALAWAIVAATAALPATAWLPAALAGGLLVAIVGRGRVALVARGLVWIALGLASAAALAAGPGGPALMLAVGLAVALSDVGAFTVGSLVGGPRLAPHLSPAKRWSGVGGNVLGAALGFGVARATFLEIGPWLLVALVVVTPVAAVIGDLAESAVKRRAGVKDAGASLPGFGGVLDRIDSLLVAIPAATYLALAVH